MFDGEAGAYLSEANFEEKLVALPTNIVLGWKGLHGMNTLA
jgi:hypothetical protein